MSDRAVKVNRCKLCAEPTARAKVCGRCIIRENTLAKQENRPPRHMRQLLEDGRKRPED